MVVQLSSALCGVLLTMGRLHEAAAVIREGLARSAVPNAGAAVRLAAASLAVRTGHPLVAEQHLRRAEELMPGLAQRPALEAPPTLAEFDLARGDGQQALRMLDETLTAQSIDSRMMDRMVTWAARAAADLRQRARDRREADAERHARKALEGLIARRSELRPEPFAGPWPGDLVQPAWQAVFEAEVARGDGVPGAAASWEAAVTACEAAGMRWEAETESAPLDPGTGCRRWNADCRCDPAEVRPPVLRGRRGRGTAAGVRRPRTGLRRRPDRPQRAARSSIAGTTVRRADGARARGAVLPGGGSDVRRGRRGVVHHPENGEHARVQPAAQDRNPVPAGSGGALPTWGNRQTLS